MEKPNYQLYRSTTLGTALQSTLESFINEQMISDNLAKRVLDSFDKSFNKIISQKARTKVTFRGEKLRAYRYCDNVWTFIMEGVDFRDLLNGAKTDRVKFVACDGTQKVLTNN